MRSMENINQQQHNNVKGLYEMALNYNLPGFGGGVTDKVRKAQELLKGEDGRINHFVVYLLLQETMSQLITEQTISTKADTVNTSVEVREVPKRKGERYSIVLHHADGSESELNLKGRNKLVYLLALMAEVSHRDVRLMAKMFVSHQELMVDLAKEIRINSGEKSVEDWVLDFVYRENPDNEDFRDRDGHKGEGYFSYDSHNYSQTKLPINRELQRCTTGRTEEYKTFELKATGGRMSYMHLSLSPDQIQLPDSLMAFVECLPTADEVERIMGRKKYKNRWRTYYDGE